MPFFYILHFEEKNCGWRIRLNICVGPKTSIPWTHPTVTLRIFIFQLTFFVAGGNMCDQSLFLRQREIAGYLQTVGLMVRRQNRYIHKPVDWQMEWVQDKTFLDTFQIFDTCPSLKKVRKSANIANIDHSWVGLSRELEIANICFRPSFFVRLTQMEHSDHPCRVREMHRKNVSKWNWWVDACWGYKKVTVKLRSAALADCLGYFPE